MLLALYEAEQNGGFRSEFIKRVKQRVIARRWSSIDLPRPESPALVLRKPGRNMLERVV
jgi:hypothetical protein